MQKPKPDTSPLKNKNNAKFKGRTAQVLRIHTSLSDLLFFFNERNLHYLPRDLCTNRSDRNRARAAEVEFWETDREAREMVASLTEGFHLPLTQSPRHQENYYFSKSTWKLSALGGQNDPGSKPALADARRSLGSLILCLTIVVAEAIRSISSILAKRRQSPPADFSHHVSDL